MTILIAKLHDGRFLAIFPLLSCRTAFAAEPSFYGNPWSANGLANLEVGWFPCRMVSYRFSAAETGRFVTAKVLFIFAIFGQGA